MYADCVGGERGAHIAETASLVYTEGQKEGLLSLPSFLHACMGEQRFFFTVLCITVQEQHLTALQSVHFVPLTCVLVCLYKALSVHPVSPLGHLLALEVWKTARSLGPSYQSKNKL